jgi:hypothetical protein
MFRERGFFTFFSLAFILFAGLCPRSAAASENDHPLYQEIRNLTLKEAGIHVSGITLEKDAARIHLAEGDLWFFAPVNGRTLGAVFIGQGGITLHPEVPGERRFLGQLVSAVPVEETFKGIVLLFADDPFLPFQGQLSTPSTAAAAKARALAGDSWNLFRKGRKATPANAFGRFFPWNVSARLFGTMLNPAGPKSFFMASGDGDKYGDFVYLEDPLGVPGHEPEEVVWLNLSEKYLGSWYAGRFRGLDQNGRSRDPHPRRLIEVEDYMIGGKLEGRTLGAMAAMSFKPLEDGISVLPLALDPRLRVVQVTGANDQPLSFIQEPYKEDGDLSVVFPAPLEKGRSTVVHFTYGGSDSITDQGNGNYSLLDRSNWYPNPGFGTYLAKFMLHFDIPANTRLLGTGKKTMEKQDGDRLQVTWVSDIPLKVAGFNYGVFEVQESVDKASGRRIETYANKRLPNELAELQVLTGMAAGDAGELGLLRSLNTLELMKKVHAEATAALAIYNDCFGPLPYDHIAITQQPFYDFGQAWPTLIFMPITAFLPSIQKELMGLNDGFYTRTFYELVCAHEVAHQWWGHWIGFSNYRDQWISEGLAVFSSSLYAQRVYGLDHALRYFDELKEQLTRKNRKGTRPIEMGGPDMGYRLDTGKTGSASQAVVYGKGGYIFHMLRMMMWDPQEGDARFLSMLKDLVATQANGFLTTAALQAQVEKFMTLQMNVRGDGRMDWFFDQWVRGTELPRYGIEYQLKSAEGGKILAELKVKQSQVSDDFVMLVPVYAQYRDKIVRLGQVRIKGNSRTPALSLQLPEKPKKLLLCARRDILCELD